MKRTIDSEAIITNLITNDTWMMDVLRAAEQMNLPDWWIGAGFFRNKIWDYIEGKESKPSRDVDLVYFDAVNAEPEADWAYDETMKTSYPFAEWEVRNQARMHTVGNFSPFTSTEDGISHWVETATCTGVKLKNGTLTYLYCYGTDDLFGLIARPTPYSAKEPHIKRFYERIEQKNWKQRWPDLQIIDTSL